MDEELIKMCNCPEIQNKWSPKVGDIVILPYKASPADALEQTFISEAMGNGYVMAGVPLALAYENSSLIFIPRIEDVLGWLGDRWHALVRQSDAELEMEDGEKRWIMDSYDEGGIAGNSYTADCPVKTLLKAYMHLEHNKKFVRPKHGKAWQIIA